MDNQRFKITFYNKHFTYISSELVTMLHDAGIEDINAFMKRKIKAYLNISIQSEEDVQLVKEKITEQEDTSVSRWVNNVILKHLKKQKYNFQIASMLCQDDILTREDVEDAQEAGYIRVCLTKEEFQKRYPDLDSSKVYYDNSFFAYIVYYDKEKYAMTELIGTPDAFLLPDKCKTIGEYAKKRIDAIYECYKQGKYDYFTYSNFIFYRNEILDMLIQDTEDKRIKAKLRKCKQITD